MARTFAASAAFFHLPMCDTALRVPCAANRACVDVVQHDSGPGRFGRTRAGDSGDEFFCTLVPTAFRRSQSREEKRKLLADKNNRGYTNLGEEVLDPSGPKEGEHKARRQPGLLRVLSVAVCCGGGYRPRNKARAGISHVSFPLQEGYYICREIDPSSPEAELPLHGAHQQQHGAWRSSARARNRHVVNDDASRSAPRRAMQDRTSGPTINSCPAGAQLCCGCSALLITNCRCRIHILPA